MYNGSKILVNPKVFAPFLEGVVHELCDVIQNYYMGYPKIANDLLPKEFDDVLDRDGS